MNTLNRESALSILKQIVEKKYGQMGGFALDHVISTKEKINQITTTKPSVDFGILGVSKKSTDRVNNALAVTQSRHAESIQQLIANSHTAFLKLHGYKNFAISYGYAPREETTKTTETLVIGDVANGDNVAHVDLSEWLTMNVKLF